MQFIEVANIQRASIHDGSGLRTTIFLKGCHLNCPWCCNPETKSENLFFTDWSKCLHKKDIYSKLCVNCSLKGGTRPLEMCPFNVCFPTFKKYTCVDLFNILKKDFSIFNINGGVTFSGGEPLLQTEVLLPLLKSLKKNNIHVAVESTLYVRRDYIDKIEHFIDEWIIDLKLQPQMFLLQGNYLNIIKNNLLKIKNKKLTIRLVIIKGLEKYIEQIVHFLKDININHIEILKCHNLAENKYRKLNEENWNFSPSDDEFNSISKKIKDLGILVNELKI